MMAIPFDVIAIVSALVSCVAAFVAVAYCRRVTTDVRLAIVEAERTIRAADMVVREAKRQDN